MLYVFDPTSYMKKEGVVKTTDLLNEQAEYQDVPAFRDIIELLNILLSRYIQNRYWRINFSRIPVDNEPLGT